MNYSINKDKFLDNTELQALTSSIKLFKESSFRDILLIELALKTGARASEILNIRLCDINHTDKTILIRGIKNSNDREIPIGDALYKRVYLYARKNKGKNLLFPISYSMLVKIWSKFKPSKKSFHSLRHTFAILLYKKHKDLRLCQIALGHKNIKNTMVYADYVYSTNELKRLLLWKYMGMQY